MKYISDLRRSEDEYLKQIGHFIVSARKERGWTQNDLIVKLDLKGVPIARNRLSAIEQGKKTKKPIDLAFLFAICDLFKVDIGHILGLYKEKTKDAHDMHEYIGISEASIDTLHFLHTRGNRKGERGAFIDGIQFDELELLDALITSSRFHYLFNDISKYLAYGSAPTKKHAFELSDVEYEKMYGYLQKRGLVTIAKHDVCDMYVQNACDELKSIYKELLARKIGGKDG